MMSFHLSIIDTEEDKTKFEVIYEKYHKLMFYVANQILKDNYLAEDAVHDSFVKFIENLDKRIGWRELINNIDVLVDGKFEEDKKEEGLKFRGSSNQRIINVKESLESESIVVLEL